MELSEYGPGSLNCRLRVSGHRPLRGQAWAIFFLSSIKPQESRVRLRPSAPRIWNTCPLAPGPWPGRPRPGGIIRPHHGWRAGWGHIFLPGHALGSATPVGFEEIKRKGKTSLPHATLSPPMVGHFRMALLFYCFSAFHLPSSAAVYRLPVPLFTLALHPAPSETLRLPDPQAAGGGDGPPSK